METLGIGQIGLGSIAATHREGYEAYGLRVVAGFDTDPSARERFAKTVPDAKVYASLADFLSAADVAVVDLAAPHHDGLRLSLFKEVLPSEKPVLVQKPLATTHREAAQIFRLARSTRVPIMVNQNMCFAPSALNLWRAIGPDAAIGMATFAQIRTEGKFDTFGHHWYGQGKRWWTLDLSVHHLGLLHHLFGPPKTMYSIMGGEPAQPGASKDGYGHLCLSYENGMNALLISSGTYFGTHQLKHGSETMWVQGSDGIIDWQLDDVTVHSARGSDRRSINRVTYPRTIQGTWFPHAFGLVMLHFQEALHERSIPWCSIQDNLYVIAAVEAAYRSSAEGRAVSLSEIMGDDYDAGYGAGWRHGYSSWTVPTAPAL